MNSGNLGVLKKIIYTLFLLIMPAAGLSQVTTSMHMIDDSLDSGENIRFTFSLHNGSDESLHYVGSSSWEVELSFRGIKELDNAITADYVSYYVHPGETSFYEFNLSPEEIFYPLHDGPQKIYATYLGHTDSVSFEAPAVYGGELGVRYDPDNGELVEAFKDSLTAEDSTFTVLDQGNVDDGFFERWKFENLQAEHLNQQIKADKRFLSARVDRFITYESNTITTVEQEPEERPSATELKQNFPNPFNPSTAIEFYLENPGRVDLSVYNIAGEKVSDLVSRPMNAGTHTISFDASGLASGVYIYRLKTETAKISRKLTVVK